MLRTSYLCILAVGISAGLLLAGLTTGNATANLRVEEPKLIIESFSPSKAYVVAGESITLCATVKNIGMGPLTKPVSGRMSCLTGLDYGEGDTLPKLTSLAPGATVTFKWKVLQNGNQGPLVASFVIESPGETPISYVIAIPRLSTDVGAEPSESLNKPSASVSDETAVLQNEHVRLRITKTDTNVAAVVLSTHNSDGWRRAAVSVPIAEVCSAEGSQLPWWEVFRVDETKAVSSNNVASLKLSGGFGLRWRATVYLYLKPGSSVIDYRLVLSPSKELKLSGVRLANIQAGSGGFGGSASEEVGTRPTDGIEPKDWLCLQAVRNNTLVVGASWDPDLSGSEAKIRSLPGIAGVDFKYVGAEWYTSQRAKVISPGVLLEFRARNFAVNPCATIEDALKFKYTISGKAPQ